MLQRKIETLPSHLDDSGAATGLARALADPLNGLMAMGELLQRQPLAEPARAQLQAMLDAGRRMTGILSGVIETVDASTPPAPTPMSLRELVDDVDARWRSERRGEAAQFLVSCNAAPDLLILADPARLRRLLDTLIEDAFQARAWGIVELQLQVQVQPGGMVAVTGRLDAAGGELSTCNPVAFDLCSALMRRMDGEIAREPSAGRGVQTVFSFQVPQAGHHPSTPLDEQEDGPLPPHTHLLIVDDNATNRIVASALCEMFGCTAETADDGVEAVEAVKSRHFDLILMDIKMPRMDGLEATKAIRALPTAAALTPIVALTANADPQSSATYLASGMQGVVDKPIKPEQLLATLQRALCTAAGDAVRAASAA